MARRNHSHDPVNRPAHYTAGDIECIDAIAAALGGQAFVDYCRGQGIRYAWRAGKKQHTAEDLRKGAWYLARAAERAEALAAERLATRLARLVAQWWQDEERTYRLSAAVLGEDSGCVRYQGRRRAMTYGEAQMFAYWMSHA